MGMGMIMATTVGVELGLDLRGYSFECGVER